MKRTFELLFIFLSLTVSAQQKIALLEPRIGDGSTTVSGMEKRMVQGELRKAIVNFSGYEAITRSDIDQMMQEQNFQRTGMVSEDQIKKLGEMSGADYICVSTLTKSDTEFYLEAYLVHLESGRMLSPASKYGELANGKLANMFPACQALATELLGAAGYSKQATPQSSRLTSNTSGLNSNIQPKSLYKVDPKWKNSIAITEECTVNIAIMHEAVKNKNYADAESAWSSVYENCPNANKSIYADGAKILTWRFENSTNANEKRKCADKLIELYDKRIFYFGDDVKYPTAYILGEKGIAYFDCYGNEKLEQSHDCLLYSIQQLGKKSKIAVLVKLVECSYALYKINRNAKQFIADYELASNYLAALAADPSFKNADIANQQKDYVDNVFAISGAADCATVDNIYEPVLKENQSNSDMVLKIIRLYRRIRCTESDVYYRACKAADKMYLSY